MAALTRAEQNTTNIHANIGGLNSTQRITGQLKNAESGKNCVPQGGTQNLFFNTTWSTENRYTQDIFLFLPLSPRPWKHC